MKQLLTILLVILLIVCTGCSSKNHFNENSVSDFSGNVESQQDSTNTSQKETSNTESNPATTERSDDTTPKQEVSTETSPPKNDNEVKSDKKNYLQSVSGTTSSAEKLKEETTDSSTSSETSEPTIPKATAADAKAIASKMVEYINAYRAEQGVSAAVVLPGLTKYAEYRSRQLVLNFAHDTVDEREAATALEYGEYIDPPLYGMTGEPYYTANAREAILKAGYTGTMDSIAERMALLTYNSKNHWNYVGNGKYCYIAIGITYESGLWYCDIAVSIKNTDN